MKGVGKASLFDANRRPTQQKQVLGEIGRVFVRLA